MHRTVLHYYRYVPGLLVVQCAPPGIDRRPREGRGVREALTGSSGSLGNCVSRANDPHE